MFQNKKHAPLLVLVASLCLTPSGLADVDLTFAPPGQVVTAGAVVEIDLVAIADTAEEEIQAIEAILIWDPAFLQLLGVDDSQAGYAWTQAGFPLNPDGLNDGVVTPWVDVPDNDGDALFMALAAPGAPAMAPPPAGLIVTTLRFQALAETTTDTLVTFLASYGLYSYTRVLPPSPPGAEITGSIDSEAAVTIDPFVPARLTLELGDDCLSEVVVELWMRDLPQLATGFQAFLEFDDAVLDFDAAGSSYSATPFEAHVGLIQDAEVAPGQLNLNGFTNEEGTSADAVLAILHFNIVAQCAVTNVSFRLLPGFVSKLSYQGVDTYRDVRLTGVRRRFRTAGAGGSAGRWRPGLQSDAARM